MHTGTLDLVPIAVGARHSARPMAVLALNHEQLGVCAAKVVHDGEALSKLWQSGAVQVEGVHGGASMVHTDDGRFAKAITGIERARHGTGHLLTQMTFWTHHTSSLSGSARMISMYGSPSKALDANCPMAAGETTVCGDQELFTMQTQSSGRTQSRWLRRQQP